MHIREITKSRYFQPPPRAQNTDGLLKRLGLSDREIKNPKLADLRNAGKKSVENKER